MKFSGGNKTHTSHLHSADNDISLQCNQLKTLITDNADIIDMKSNHLNGPCLEILPSEPFGFWAHCLIPHFHKVIILIYTKNVHVWTWYFLISPAQQFRWLACEYFITKLPLSQTLCILSPMTGLLVNSAVGIYWCKESLKHLGHRSIKGSIHKETTLSFNELVAVR